MLTGNLADTPQTSILVDHFRRAQVTDFSLTTIHPNHRSTCNASYLVDSGTRWTAPEVLDEITPLTGKADVFSFAMLMVEVSSAHATQRLPAK